MKTNIVVLNWSLVCWSFLLFLFFYFFAMWCKASILGFFFFFSKATTWRNRGEWNRVIPRSRWEFTAERCLFSTLGKQEGVIEAGWGCAASIKLGQDHCKRTQSQRTLLLLKCVRVRTQTDTHARTLQESAMCISSLGEEARYASTWSTFAYTPSHGLCSPSNNRHRRLFSLLHLSPWLGRGGAFDVQFWGAQGVIRGLRRGQSLWVKPTPVWYQQCTSGSTTVWYEKWPTAETLNKLCWGFP